MNQKNFEQKKLPEKTFPKKDPNKIVQEKIPKKRDSNALSRRPHRSQRRCANFIFNFAKFQYQNPEKDIPKLCTT